MPTLPQGSSEDRALQYIRDKYFATGAEDRALSVLTRPEEFARSAGFAFLKKQLENSYDPLADADLPGPVRALGFATNATEQVAKLRDLVRKLTEGKPYLKNPVAEQSNRIFEYGKGLFGRVDRPALPEDVFYHGGPDKLSYLESPGIRDQAVIQDPNVSLGTHFGTVREQSDSFIARSGPRALYLAKLRASNPRYYTNENLLRRELLAEGLLSGDTQEEVARLAGDFPDVYGELLGKPLKARDFTTLLRNASTIGDVALPPAAADKVGTQLIEKMLKGGQDAIMYGNLGEGWRGSPSVVVPFKEQIEVLRRLPVSTRNLTVQNIRDYPYLYNRTVKPTVLELLQKQGLDAANKSEYTSRMHNIFEQVP